MAISCSFMLYKIAIFVAMTLRLTTKRLRRVPMLKALLPLICGVALAHGFDIPSWFAIGGFVVCSILAIVVRSTLYSATAILLFGVIVVALHVPNTTTPLNRRVSYSITIDRNQSKGKSSLSTHATITSVRGEDGWRVVSDRIMIHSDTATRLAMGDRILCHGTVRPFGGSNRSFLSLMNNRGYIGSIYLTEDYILERESSGENRLQGWALSNIDKLDMEGDELALCKAMVVGDKSAISSTLRQAYSTSGAAHILAVSGLHVGIVFMFVNLLLWWLPVVKRGHIIRNVLAIILVWLYAVMVGLSPSVVRAAMMFSALQFAFASTSTYISANILATAAFVMLVISPSYLYDISFQLSFIAVAAILGWAMPLYRYFKCRYTMLNVCTAVIIIGLCSTLATAPLVSSTFGVVSLVGVVINPAIILTANIIIPISLLWIILPFDFIRPAIEIVGGGGAWLQNKIVAESALLPLSAIEYQLSDGGLVAIYTVFITITALGWCVETKKRVSLSQ